MNENKTKPSFNQYGEIENYPGTAKDLQYPVRRSRDRDRQEEGRRTSGNQTNLSLPGGLVLISVVCLVVVGFLILANSQSGQNGSVANTQPIVQVPQVQSVAVNTPQATPHQSNVGNTATPAPTSPPATIAPTTATAARSLRVVYVRGNVGNTDIYVADQNGRNQTCVACRTCDEAEPAWSPDGRYIIYHSDCGGSYDLWYVSATGGEVVQLTRTSNVDEREPDWSPDGSQIVYRANSSGSDRNQDGDLRVMNRNGSEDRSLGIRGRSPSWSPDGSKITYMSAQSGRWQIYVYDVRTRTTTQLTNCSANCRWPAWSPDGRYVIYHTTTGASSFTADTIWRQPFSGGSATAIVSGSHAGRPSWSSQGKIVFNSDRGIEVISADGSSRTTIISGDQNWAPVWSE